MRKMPTMPVSTPAMTLRFEVAPDRFSYRRRVYEMQAALTIEIDCPWCIAKAGERCYGPDGSQVDRIHSPRWAVIG